MADSTESTNQASTSSFNSEESDTMKLDKSNSYSIYDPGPNPNDVARRIGLVVPDTTGGGTSSGRA